MDANKFLAEFGHIANAPGGVARLRELVLHLAITGKVVPQIENDFEAHSIIEQMRNHASKNSPKKRATSKKKTISRQHISESKIPSNWVVADLGELGDWGAGSTPSRSNSIYYGGTIPWFKSGELKADLISIAEEHVSDLALRECSLRLNSPGDVLIAMYGANIGQTSIIEVESTTNQAVCACTPYEGLSNRFLLITLKALKGFFIGLGAGGAQPNISKEKITATRIGLPPTEEQSRIVAKVDELMALCDQLEAQQQKRRTLQNHLRQATLQAVAASQSPHELQESWQRLQVNFGQLFSAPEDVAALRTLILNVGMQGLLVEKNDFNTPVDELLSAIASERQALISSKALKPNAAIPLPHQDDLPYVLPKGWKWARIMDLVDVGTGATPAKAENSYYGGSTPWYTSSATNEKFARLPETLITDKALKETNCKIFPAGSLIVAMYGQGKTRGQVSEIVVPGATNQAVAALVFFDASLRSKRFIKYFFEKIYDEIREQAEGGPQPNLNVRKIKETLIPVPPIEEQEKIVIRLDELMNICDQLEALLKEKSKNSERLATASVSTLTGIAIEKEEEPMKAPQTQLVAPVRLGTPPDVKAQAPLATILARHNGKMSAKDLWQRFGGEIDAFYAQLKTEVAHGWLLEPAPAEMHEKAAS